MVITELSTLWCAQPLSAALMQKEDPPASSPEPSSPPNSLPQPSWRPSIFRWKRGPSPPPPSSPPPDYNTVHGTMQLAVAIVMPLQRGHSRRRSEGVREPVVYELGFARVPWDGKREDVLPSEDAQAEHGQEGSESIV